MMASVDTRFADRYCAAVLKQIPFAKAVALNRTGEEINAALRQAIPEEFTLRFTPLLRYVAPLQLPLPDRATKDRLEMTVRTQGKGRILNPYEMGRPHTGSVSSPVAVPTRALRFQDRTVIPRRWYPSSLGLVARKDPTGQSFFALGKNAIRNKKTPVHKTARGVTQIKGKNRTFVLDPALQRGLSPKQAGVYIRVGPSRGDIRMIWWYIMQVPRPRILRFKEIAIQTFWRRFPVNFQGALAFALRTAK